MGCPLVDLAWRDEDGYVQPLVTHAEDYRIEHNTVRSHEAIAWNRPLEVHTGIADPVVLDSPEPQDPPAARRETWTVLHLDTAVVERSEDTTGSTVLPRRWVVERTFAWISEHRRCVRAARPAPVPTRPWFNPR